MYVILLYSIVFVLHSVYILHIQNIYYIEQSILQSSYNQYFYIDKGSHDYLYVKAAALSDEPRELSPVSAVPFIVSFSPLLLLYRGQHY